MSTTYVTLQTPHFRTFMEMPFHRHHRLHLWPLMTELDLQPFALWEVGMALEVLTL